MKKHILEINFGKEKKENSWGLFSYTDDKSEMYVCLEGNRKDTLIHELTHFILAMTTKNWYNHSKKFKKLYETIKNL